MTSTQSVCVHDHTRLCMTVSTWACSTPRCETGTHMAHTHMAHTCYLMTLVVSAPCTTICSASWASVTHTYDDLTWLPTCWTGNAYIWWHESSALVCLVYLMICTDSHKRPHWFPWRKSPEIPWSYCCNDMCGDLFFELSGQKPACFFPWLIKGCF